jgi:hypothetical protein
LAEYRRKQAVTFPDSAQAAGFRQRIHQLTKRVLAAVAKIHAKRSAWVSLVAQLRQPARHSQANNTGPDHGGFCD